MRVLLADDQTDVRWALRVLLQEEPGLSLVGEAIKTEELLAQSQIIQPDLILLDWELPGQPTKKMLMMLHALIPRPQIIALSGRSEARQAALAAGVDAFISKGDPPEQLLNILRQMRTKIDGNLEQGDLPMSTLLPPSPTTHLADQALAARVRQALFEVERLRLLHSPIHVEAQDGLIILRGVVATPDLKQLALQAVYNIASVQQIQDELLTEPDIEIGIAQALAADPRTHTAIIRVNATNDYVVLAGQVPNSAVAQIAEAIARGTPGVQKVVNRLQVISRGNHVNHDRSPETNTT